MPDSWEVTGCCNFLHTLDPECYTPNFVSFNLFPNTTIVENEGNVVLQPSSTKGSIVLTCEHSSNLLPEGYEWSELDRRFSQRHDAVDIGIWLIVAAMYEALSVPVILARYSRLFIDLNRSVNCSTLILENCHGTSLEMNRDKEEVKRRFCYLDYYRDAVETVIQANPVSKLVLAMHSFTPIFEWTHRTVEIGILFDPKFVDTRIVQHLETNLSNHGYCVRQNEPYRGDTHPCEEEAPPAKAMAHKHGLNYILLEIRQDLAVNKEWRDLFLERFIPILKGIEL